ncbi:EcsC family protein [Psychrobacter lutiphocae]|uniref:EcsC family protein n=1 Tax=Psychrobacter lutiphocae TaxID=540500 RepID=UPI000380E683|nr:EcsC family protein [Psychrobacter lutiphocae]
MDKKSKRNKASKFVVKGLDTAGLVARNNLERFGSLLDNLNAKSGKANQFKAVDLSNYKTGNASNLLSQQTLKTSQQLLGPRFATYGKYAKKVVPDSLAQKAADSVFSQVAKLAASWSQVDLPNEQRFAGIQGLSDQERNALARDIANQNRALATLGGVTGLAGLLGMLADTLWLLLVSLRTVYQLATVYDKPLTGKQGVKMAYAVLSHADLSKMQEKQTILAALGVVKGLVANADNSGLRNELIKGVGIASSNVQFYAQQVDKLAEQFNFDLDNINLSWLSRVLPLVSVATTVHYNSFLIDQVIGVAKATFGPEPITAKEAIADKSNAKADDAESKSETEAKETKAEAKPEAKSEAKAEQKSAEKPVEDKAEKSAEKEAAAEKSEADKSEADKKASATSESEKKDTAKAETESEANKSTADSKAK